MLKQKKIPHCWNSSNIK